MLLLFAQRPGYGVAALRTHRGVVLDYYPAFRYGCPLWSVSRRFRSLHVLQSGPPPFVLDYFGFCWLRSISLSLLMLWLRLGRVALATGSACTDSLDII